MASTFESDSENCGGPLHVVSLPESAGDASLTESTSRYDGREFLMSMDSELDLEIIWTTGFLGIFLGGLAYALWANLR